MTGFATADFEGGGRGEEPKHVGNFEKMEKTRKQILPLSLQKEDSPAHTLIAAQ